MKKNEQRRNISTNDQSKRRVLKPIVAEGSSVNFRATIP